MRGVRRRADGRAVGRAMRARGMLGLLAKGVEFRAYVPAVSHAHAAAPARPEILSLTRARALLWPVLKDRDRACMKADLLVTMTPHRG